MKTISAIFSIVFLTSAQDLEINNKCSYSMNKAVFTCSNLQNISNNIEKFITSQTRMLVIKNNDAISFSSYYHNTTNYQHVINYNILDNNHLNIDGCGFCGMTDLQYMTVTRNFLPTLKNYSFNGLQNLETLTLSQNNITTLEENCFSDLKKLFILDLAQNNVQKIPSNLFHDLSHLKALQLEHNNVHVIEEGAFSGLPRLEILDIRFNNLKILNAKNFNLLPKLQTLDLSYNQIKLIADDFKLTNLEFLTISNNKLEDLQDGRFRSLKNVRSIDLSNNKMSGVTDKPFRYLSTLKLLNLRNNYVNTSCFTELRKDILVIT